MGITLTFAEWLQTQDAYAPTAIFSRTKSPITSAGVFWVAIALVKSQSAQKSSMVMERAALRR